MAMLVDVVACLCHCLQSLLMSTLALLAEALGLRYLYNTNVPSLTTVVSGTLIIQFVLATACGMFGVLWFRAMSRVRASLKERAATVARVSDVLSRLSSRSHGQAVSTVLSGVVRLQCMVRRRAAELRVSRLRAIASYEALSRERNWLLTLVHCVAAGYLLACVYIVVLYGELLSMAR